MPTFNHENPVNAEGKALETPEEKLLRLCRQVLTEEGYAGLGRDRLLQMGCEPQALLGYRDAEDLCDAVVDDLVDRIGISYASITEDARAYLEEGNYTRDESFQKIERLLYRHIYLCFHPRNRTYVLMCLQEDHLPRKHRERLAKVLWTEFVSVLARLIQSGAEVRNEQESTLLACAAVGSISTFIQSPQLCREAYRGMTRMDPNYAVIEDFLNNHLMRSIWVGTSMNKPF